ncbi:hypothetical protein EVAR_29395_1 [Eumeta japonica]|uniref:Uncharacterized protein n=1 Tax=Eumeta variegata TaxID=151549 RepID=A0A4C1ZWF4_EUMVA|nr:hypothetical protein EVAR_29395_1 [Eumeta japonica]
MESYALLLIDAAMKERPPNPVLNALSCMYLRPVRSVQVGRDGRTDMPAILQGFRFLIGHNGTPKTNSKVPTDHVVTGVEKICRGGLAIRIELNESRLTIQINTAILDGKVGKDRPRKCQVDHIGGILKRAKF